MNTAYDIAIRIAVFSAVAGCMEILLPDGKLKESLLAFAGLSAAALIINSLLMLVS